MEPIRILHTSDLHLDDVLTDYRREVRATRRRELIDAFNFLVDAAIRREVRVLFVAGDLISASSAADSTIDTVREGFIRLGRASIAVAVVPGEAEEQPGLSVLREACRADNVHLLAGEEWSHVSPIPGLTIWGLRTTSRNSGGHVLGNLRVEGSGWHVGVMHGTYSKAPGVEPLLAPVSADDIAGAGLHYLALGHNHEKLNCVVGSAACWYSGSPVHLGFDTRGERHALLVVLRDDGPRVDLVKVPSRAHRVVTIDVTGMSPDQLRKRLSQLITADLCLRVELQGYLDPYDAALPGRIQKEFEGKCFHLELVDLTDFALMPSGRAGRQNVRGARLGGPERAFAARIAGESPGECTDTGVDIGCDAVRRRALKLGLAAMGEARTFADREALSSGKRQKPHA